MKLGLRPLWAASVAIPVATVGLMAGPAMAEIAPAGSVIGNQATAVYETSAGLEVSVQSNLVETLVNQIATVDIEAAYDTAQADAAPELDDALVGPKAVSTSGGVVTFAHTITNLGNGIDTFTLTAPDSGLLTGVQIFPDSDSNGVADSTTAITVTPPLTAGETFGIVVQAVVGAGAATTGTDGEDDPVVVTAESQFSAGVTDAVNDDISYQAGPIIVTNKTITPSNGVPGDTLQITLTYQNTGTSTGIVRVSDPLPPELVYQAGTATWSLGSGALTEAADATTNNYEQTAGTGAQIDYQVDTATNLGLNTANAPYTADPNTVLIEISDVPPGTSGSVTFDVAIAATAATGSHNNRVYSCAGTLTCDPAEAGPAPTFTVDASLGLTFADSQSVADTPRAGAGLGDPYADPAVALGGTLTSGAGLAAGADTDGDDTNDVVEDDGTNGNLAGAWGAGSEIPFSFILSNDSNTTETFNLTEAATTLIAGDPFPASTTFRFETPSGQVILDNDFDGNPDVTVPAGGAVEVILIANLDAAETRLATDAAWIREVVATSQGDATLINESVAALTSAVVTDTVDLQNVGPSSGDIADAGVDRDGSTVVTEDDDITLDGTATGDPFNVITTDPNTTADFTLRIVNTSATAQSFDLQYYADPTGAAPPTGAPIGATFAAGTGLPAGWTVEFLNGTAPISNTGVLGAGASLDVTARVTVPDGATPGDVDLWFKAVSPTSGAFDVKLDRVTVNPIVDVQITPDQSGQASSGGTVVLNHSVSNVGNVAITDGAISFTTSFPTFTGELYVDDGNGIFDAGDTVVASIADVLTALGDAAFDPGESFILFNRVQTLPGALEGQSEQAVITIASALTDDTAGAVTDGNTDNNAVTDTVTIITGDLELVKLQARDDDCDGAPETAFQQSQLSADPGNCIVYHLTATNTGSGDALNVEIRDVTPAFTTYEIVTGTLPDATKAGAGAGTATITTQPASTGATGDIIATFGTLEPGDVATLSFAVEINGNLPNTTGGASTPLQAGN